MRKPYHPGQPPFKPKFRYYREHFQPRPFSITLWELAVICLSVSFLLGQLLSAIAYFLFN